MKEITLFMMETCPFCQQAFRWMDEVVTEHPEYRTIPVRRIDERFDADYANQFDYYLVPTFYIDGEKVHEGIASKKIIESIYQKAYRGL